jgi:hypothetical protein
LGETPNSWYDYKNKFSRRLKRPTAPIELPILENKNTGDKIAILFATEQQAINLMEGLWK